MTVKLATKFGVGMDSACPECGGTFTSEIHGSRNKRCVNCKTDFKPLPGWMSILAYLPEEEKEQVIHAMNGPKVNWMTKDGIEFKLGMPLYEVNDYEPTYMRIINTEGSVIDGHGYLCGPEYFNNCSNGLLMSGTHKISECYGNRVTAVQIVVENINKSIERIELDKKLLIQGVI